MKAYGCQGKAVADQPDGSTGGKEEERKQLMLKSAVYRSVKEAKEGPCMEVQYICKADKGITQAFKDLNLPNQ